MKVISLFILSVLIIGIFGARTRGNVAEAKPPVVSESAPQAAQTKGIAPIAPQVAPQVTPQNATNVIPVAPLPVAPVPVAPQNTGAATNQNNNGA